MFLGLGYDVVGPNLQIPKGVSMVMRVALSTRTLYFVSKVRYMTWSVSKSTALSVKFLVLLAS